MAATFQVVAGWSGAASNCWVLAGVDLIGVHQPLLIVIQRDHQVLWQSYNVL